MHIVSEENAKSRLKIVGWRLATADERAAYEKADGNQRFNKPLAAPFKPIPTDAVTLDGAEFVPVKKDETIIEPSPIKKGRKVIEA